jgi:hypothetical protein
MAIANERISRYARVVTERVAQMIELHRMAHAGRRDPMCVTALEVERDELEDILRRHPEGP